MNRILAGCALLFVIIQFGPRWLSAVVDDTWSRVIATAAMGLHASGRVDLS